MTKGFSLTKNFEEQRNKESSSGTSSRSVFNVSSSHNRYETKEGEGKGEAEMAQDKEKSKDSRRKMAVSEEDPKRNSKEVESVVEFFGAVAISNTQVKRVKAISKA